MELVGAVQHLCQQTAECVASYRPGQLVLRQMDRALWVLEKAARWAVPPPLEQDERPQPELVRPLPWALFLVLLLALRVTRESISIFNLVIGKPPLHSADVVMYLQCKRRYLRALKYQGNRSMRARRASAEAGQASWLSGLSALFDFTMCFRRSRDSHADQGNANSEEILVVRRQQPAREEETPPAAAPATAAESTMERLIERMMVDLNTDSDDDSNYTLTNATSPKNSISDPDSDNESSANSSSLNTPNNSIASDSTITNGDSAPSSPKEVSPKPENISTPTKTDPEATTPTKTSATSTEPTSSPTKTNAEPATTPTKTSPAKNETSPCEEAERRALGAGAKNERDRSPNKQEAENFVANERVVTPQRSPKKTQKLDHSKKLHQNDR